MRVTSATRQFIFEKGQEFKSAHASTIVLLPNGEALSAWFGGEEEGADDVNIWLSRYKEGQWSVPTVVASDGQIAHWNPVLFRTKTGKVQLYYKVGAKIRDWYTKLIESEDGGATWSEPRELVPGDIGGRGPVRSKPIYLRDGSLLAPASIETETEWDAFTDRSEDDGLTWSASEWVPIDHGTFPPKGIIQPTLWETDEGVHMLLRSSAGEIFRSDSRDNARTWSPMYEIGLPNPNSGIDLVQLHNGTLALVYNPTNENWGKRSPLVLVLSDDNGKTWGEPYTLEEGQGEFSYPAVVADGNTLYITYTWNRENIVFRQLTLE